MITLSEKDIIDQLSQARARSAASPFKVSSQELEWLMEEATGQSRIQRMLAGAGDVHPQWKETFLAFLQRRLKGEPTQYILQKAGFYGRDFKVDKRVLIPRPETELLVEWVVEKAKEIQTPRILDIGTGSGCIAITLALEVPTSKVVAIDISEEALHVASNNATMLGASVAFKRMDVLEDAIGDEWPTPKFDFIVSNPPYIPDAEKEGMQSEVVDHEPHIALFVGPDPLFFYRRLAAIGTKLVRPGGWIVMETHSAFSKATQELFGKKPFGELGLNKDLAGKDRFVSARVDLS